MVTHKIRGDAVEELIERWRSDGTGKGAWDEGYSDGKDAAARELEEFLSDKSE